MRRLATLLFALTLAACAGPAAQLPSSPDPTTVVTPSPSPVGPLFPYQEAACDPNDPRITGAGFELPNGVGPEARIAAACMALEWLNNDPVDPSVVTELRGPTVHPKRNATDTAGLLAMERLIGKRFQQPSGKILLMVIGNDMEWACTYGRANIDPLIPRPLPWSDEWLGCTKKQWVCGGSNIKLTDGTRFIFGACPKSIIDASKPPNPDSKWNGLRSGHELIQILFFEMSNGDWGVPRGTWRGLIARDAGVQYFERAAAWLAGTPRDWRFDEAGAGQYTSARDAWAEWRETPAGKVNDLSFEAIVVGYDWTTAEDPIATLSGSFTSFAGEYLVAHYGIEALFSWLSGTTSFKETFGESETELLSTISSYIQAQFEGLPQ